MVATRNEMVAVPGVGTWDVLVMGPSSSKMGGEKQQCLGPFLTALDPPRSVIALG